MLESMHTWRPGTRLFRALRFGCLEGSGRLPIRAEVPPLPLPGDLGGTGALGEASSLRPTGLDAGAQIGAEPAGRQGQTGENETRSGP